ncbi:MAG: gluconokinase [Chitinophagaceae bacterium]
MNYLIGVDIGTTHTKAVATSTTGQVFFEEKASYPTLQPQPGFSEQDPLLIFEAVIQVLEKVLASIPVEGNVTAVCFSAAMHSIMAIDKAGKSLTNLYTWADTRSNKYAFDLKDSEKGKRIYFHTGTAVHPMSPLCKIAWIKNELPDIFTNTHKFISVKEYVFYRLFDKYMVDFSVASATGLFNIRTLKWNEESLQYAGITADSLSELVSTTHAETALNKTCNDRIGLQKEIPFYVGSSDGCLAILGSGATAPNEAALTIGTSGAVRKMSSHPLIDDKGRLFNYILDDVMFGCGGASNNGGIVLKWFAENMLEVPFSSAESFEWFMQTAAKAPAGCNGLIFLPYISGERSPVWDANARGMFLGISNIHKREHFMRAILEGISFSMSQILFAMEETDIDIDTVYASGGFIESDFWLQMLSDVLNKKIIVSYAADASAMGAIFLALKALGFIKEWNEVKNMVETSAVFQPSQQTHKQYAKNFGIFKSLYKKLAPDFAILAEMNQGAL